MTRLAALLLVFVVGCGASARARVNTGVQEGMNITTDVVDPGYELAVVSCDVAEGVAIDVNTDAETAGAQIRRIRAECDRIFASFETLRVTQASLRAAGDAYEAGDLSFGRLAALLTKTKEMAAQVKELVATFRRSHLVEIER